MIQLPLSQKSQPTAQVPHNAGYNHYILSRDLAVTVGAVVALCGASWDLDTTDAAPVVNVTRPRDTFAAVDLPVCPDCKAFYDAKPSGRPAPRTTPVTNPTCKTWCTHPDDLGDGTNEDDACFSDEAVIPAGPRGQTINIQLQAYTDDDTSADSGIVISLDGKSPIVLTGAQTRILAAALNAHANHWEGR